MSTIKANTIENVAGTESHDVATMGIDSGSNANGSYIKFPDGTLICTVSTVNIVRESAYTMRYFWTFPMSFIVDPTITETLASLTPDTLRTIGRPYVEHTDNASCEYRFLFDGDCPVGAVATGDIIAIGRWK